MTNNDKCFIYINCCVFNGLEVSKIGITNNVKKRLNEFNLGLTYRARHFNDLTNVKLVNVYAKPLPSRFIAGVIEKAAHKELKHLMLTEFGREVFNVSSEQSIKLIDGLISEHSYD